MTRKPRELAPKLTCPVCGCEWSRVVPRDLKQVTAAEYRRHRRCTCCGSEYETSESVTGIRKNTRSSADNHAA